MFRQQTISVVWKASCHRMFCQQTIDVVWTVSGNRVIRQHTFEILCDVENLLILPSFMYRGKLTILVCIINIHV